ncbi:SapC family protein [Microbulbifer sp. ANSA003]|uniref:SapC family protein n=1 Tax=Microbulbifer sp. ANSA003 TaxID=3243360 RepID=UPI004042CE4F
MKQWVVLDKKKHRNVRLLKSDLSHSKNLHVCSILLTEFTPVAHACPIIFAKSKDSGKLESSALLGVKPGENLFWQEGQWQGEYVPESVRNYPFCLKYKQNDFSSAYICIESSLLSAGKCTSPSVSLFEVDGKASKDLLEIQRRLKKSHFNRMQVWKFIDILQKFNLLEEKIINIDLADGLKHKFTGVYCISESRLQKLEAEKFLKLRELGYLPFIYSHLFSLQKASALSALYQKYKVKVLH